MIQITGLTTSPYQTFRINISSGLIKFTARFLPASQIWLIDIEYKTFVVYGLRLCNNVNILHKFRKIIPFGLAVTVSDGTEPFLINDLESERVILYVLSQSEVEEIEAIFQEENS
jgi:hypothetical protein